MGNEVLPACGAGGAQEARRECQPRHGTGADVHGTDFKPCARRAGCRGRMGKVVELIRIELTAS